VNRRLGRAFFTAEAPDVAPRLLGKVLVVGALTGRISEVEAYTRDDPASHSFRGETRRNSVMFGPPGHLYVYFTYGMHYCANIVTGHPDDQRGQAVLIRAVQPLEGIDEMIRRRGRSVNIADGPGKLCQAFGIGPEMNGADVCTSDSIRIIDDGTQPPLTPKVTSRIGIRLATERQWRWSS
jgi:DNA-3-methyladenine glycosylase